MILEKKTLTPVSILIHHGAPSDSKIFDEVLKELKRRRLIKPKNLIYLDRGYSHMKTIKLELTNIKVFP